MQVPEFAEAFQKTQAAGRTRDALDMPYDRAASPEGALVIGILLIDILLVVWVFDWPSWKKNINTFRSQLHLLWTANCTRMHQRRSCCVNPAALLSINHAGR